MKPDVFTLQTVFYPVGVLFPETDVHRTNAFDDSRSDV